MRGYVPDASDSVISGTVRIVLKVIVEDPERYFNEGQSNRTTMRRSILGLPLSGERILSGRKRAERLTKSLSVRLSNKHHFSCRERSLMAERGTSFKVASVRCCEAYGSGDACRKSTLTHEPGNLLSCF